MSRRFWYSPSKLKWPEKAAPLCRLGQHRKSHVDPGLRMNAAGKRRHLRRRPAAKQAHRCGGIGTHVQQAPAAELAMVAEISDRQRRNDELGVDLRERSLLRNEVAERLKMRVIAEHDRFGEKAFVAARLRDRAFGGLDARSSPACRRRHACRRQARQKSTAHAWRSAARDRRYPRRHRARRSHNR